jgi:hypothetical protein
MSELAHRVISLPHGNSVAFGLKGTLGRILRVDGLVAAAPTPSSAAGAHVQTRAIPTRRNRLELAKFLHLCGMMRNAIDGSKSSTKGSA